MQCAGVYRARLVPDEVARQQVQETAPCSSQRMGMLPRKGRLPAAIVKVGCVDTLHFLS